MIFNDINDFRKYAYEKLSKTRNEAIRRYDDYKDKDPYPDIEPALLNSVDIFKYVCTTGMIYPFYPIILGLKENKNYLAGASYVVGIEGDVVYWDENGKKCEKVLKNADDSFDLKRNSIAFVTLEPYFQIPNYLALRFNLKISHVYKGLLLGTGPLVDPGFVGKLSIPLHNLTANTYRFKKGDGLIQLEFTKLSKYDEGKWENDLKKDKVNGFYIKNKIPPNRTVHKYIKKALAGNPDVKSVRSSIPDAIGESRKNVEEAKISAEKAEKTIRNFTLGGAIGIGITLLTAIIGLVSLFNDINGRIDKLYDQNEMYKSKIITLESANKSLQETVEELNIKLEELENDHANENEPEIIPVENMIP